MFSGEVPLTLLQTYVLCVVGIIISIVLPILRNLLPKPPEANLQDAQSSFWTVFWQKSTPYLVVGLFSLLTGLLVVAFTFSTLNDWRAALLAGYAWDSTLQKLTNP